MTCEKCAYYDPVRNRCNANLRDIYSLEESDECGEFIELPESKCEHRYEYCNENCTNVCKKKPSEQGCLFVYKCNYDSRSCDKRCKLHELRWLLTDKRNQLNQNKSMQSFMEGLAAISAKSPEPDPVFAQDAEKLGKICSGLEAELEELKQMLKEEEERGNNVSS